MAHRLPVADIKFIGDFAAFCRTKGDEWYDYTRPSDCALAQFLVSSGRVDYDRQPCGLKRFANWHAPADSGLRVALNPGDVDYRFSALADRLEALIVEAPMVRS